MKILNAILAIVAAILLSACATSVKHQDPTLFEAFEVLFDSETIKNQEAFIQSLYHARTWLPYKQLEHDPIELSERSEIPINQASTKIIGPSYEDSIRSLAAKLWMIEHAEHTLDLTYYIFKYDPMGYAILGALCNAVKRGVDIRIMVDSLGSLHMSHSPIRALETCTEQAGYLRDVHGHETTYRARVQFVIINALTSVSSWSNRRAHDKLIIKDGNFPGKDMVMTGGRNISVDYYGINKDGSRNPDTYLDLEILLRSEEDTPSRLGDITVGDVSGIYYTLLFLHKGNRRIYPIKNDYEGVLGLNDPYPYERKKAQQALAFIKGVPEINKAYAEMPAYLNEGFRTSQVRLAHEMGNLVSKDVVSNAEEIKSRNNNSIATVLFNALDEAKQAGNLTGNIRMVSPYLFIAQYKDKEGNIFYDGAKEILKLLQEYPDLSFEIITNSVLTSDNFHTQSVIDMDTAPRLLLSEEMQQVWRSNREASELNPEFINSEAWKRLIDHPRIKIYQTGKLDSVLIGGDQHYGKLHAKCFFGKEVGFVGTSNFDYRSRLYNNEMGFYYRDAELSEDLNKVFDELRTISLPWGSEEWLEMRKKLIETGSFKGYTTSSQRGRYKFLKGTGLIWLF